jgi:tetratricopeptide (TPR) repeat protein
LEFYRKSAKLDTQYHEAWYGIGKCMDLQDKPYEAIHHFKKAVKLDRENPAYWLALGNAEYKLGNMVSCMEAYEEACLLDPLNMEVWQNWSYVMYENGDIDKAIILIMSGIEEIPIMLNYTTEPRYIC